MLQKRKRSLDEQCTPDSSLVQAAGKRMRAAAATDSSRSHLAAACLQSDTAAAAPADAQPRRAAAATLAQEGEDHGAATAGPSREPEMASRKRRSRTQDTSIPEQCGGNPPEHAEMTDALLETPETAAQDAIGAEQRDIHQAAAPQSGTSLGARQDWTPTKQLGSAKERKQDGLSAAAAQLPASDSKTRPLTWTPGPNVTAALWLEAEGPGKFGKLDDAALAQPATQSPNMGGSSSREGQGVEQLKAPHDAARGDSQPPASSDVHTNGQAEDRADVILDTQLEEVHALPEAGAQGQDAADGASESSEDESSDDEGHAGPDGHADQLASVHMQEDGGRSDQDEAPATQPWQKAARLSLTNNSDEDSEDESSDEEDAAAQQPAPAAAAGGAAPGADQAPGAAVAEGQQAPGQPAKTLEEAAGSKENDPAEQPGRVSEQPRNAAPQEAESSSDEDDSDEEDAGVAAKKVDQAAEPRHAVDGQQQGPSAAQTDAAAASSSSSEDDSDNDSESDERQLKLDQEQQDQGRKFPEEVCKTPANAAQDESSSLSSSSSEDDEDEVRKGGDAHHKAGDAQVKQPLSGGDAEAIMGEVEGQEGEAANGKRAAVSKTGLGEGEEGAEASSSGDDQSEDGADGPASDRGSIEGSQRSDE